MVGLTSQLSSPPFELRHHVKKLMFGLTWTSARNRGSERSAMPSRRSASGTSAPDQAKAGQCASRTAPVPGEWIGKLREADPL
jgi:hypothetical protein